jgi:hypothetical protein
MSPLQTFRPSETASVLWECDHVADRSVSVDPIDLTVVGVGDQEAVTPDLHPVLDTLREEAGCPPRPLPRPVPAAPGDMVGCRVMTEADLAALVGTRFPGGEYTIAHWENMLLTDCTGRGPMSGDLAHPIVLFHVPIQGAGTSIDELFKLGGGNGRAGSVTLLGYDWEYLRPLREDCPYRIDGGIVDAKRTSDEFGRPTHDDISFSIELCEPSGDLAARVTNRWRCIR